MDLLYAKALVPPLLVIFVVTVNSAKSVGYSGFSLLILDSPEEEKKKLETQLNDSLTDHAELMRITDRLGKVIEELDEKSFRWLELSEKG